MRAVVGKRQPDDLEVLGLVPVSARSFFVKIKYLNKLSVSEFKTQNKN